MQNRSYKFIEILKAAVAGSKDIATILDQIAQHRPSNLLLLLETTLQTYERADHHEGFKRDTKDLNIPALLEKKTPQEQFDLCLAAIDDLKKEEPANRKMLLDRVKYEILNVILYFLIATKGNDINANAMIDIINEHGNECDRKLLLKQGVKLPLIDAVAISGSVDELLLGFLRSDQDKQTADLTKSQHASSAFEEFKSILLSLPGPFNTLDEALAALISTRGFTTVASELQEKLQMDVEIIPALTTTFKDKEITDIIKDGEPAQLLSLATTLERHVVLLDNIRETIDQNENLPLARKLAMYRTLQILNKLVVDRKRMLADSMLARLEGVDKKELSNLDPNKPKQHIDIQRIIDKIRERRNLGKAKEAALASVLRKNAGKIKNCSTPQFAMDTTEVIKFIAYISAAGSAETKTTLAKLKPAIKPELILAVTLEDNSKSNESSPEMTRVFNADNHPQGQKIELANAAFQENVCLTSDPDARAAYRDFCEFYLFSNENDENVENFSKLIQACYTASDIRNLQAMIKQSENNDGLKKLIMNMIDSFDDEVDLIQKMSDMFNRLTNAGNFSTQLITNCMKGAVCFGDLEKNLGIAAKGCSLLKILYMKYDSDTVDQIIQSAFPNIKDDYAIGSSSFISSYIDNSTVLKLADAGDTRIDAQLCLIISLFNNEKLDVNDPNIVGSFIYQLNSLKKSIIGLKDKIIVNAEDLSLQLTSLEQFIEDKLITLDLSQLGGVFPKGFSTLTHDLADILNSNIEREHKYDDMPVENQILANMANIIITKPEANRLNDSLLNVVRNYTDTLKAVNDRAMKDSALRELNDALRKVSTSVGGNSCVELSNNLKACVEINKNLRDIDGLPFASVNKTLINIAKVLTQPYASEVLGEVSKFAAGLKDDKELTLEDKTKILRAVNNGLNLITQPEANDRLKVEVENSLKNIRRSYSAKVFVLNICSGLLNVIGKVIKPAKTKCNELKNRIVFFNNVAQSAETVRKQIPRAVR